VTEESHENKHRYGLHSIRYSNKINTTQCCWKLYLCNSEYYLF